MAWSDSDWAGDLRTRRSTTGSVVKIGHHTVLIRAAGQKVVPLCRTASARAMSLRKGAKEVAVENEADLVTKVQPAAMIKSHIGRMSFELCGRKHHKALQR